MDQFSTFISPLAKERTMIFEFAKSINVTRMHCIKPGYFEGKFDINHAVSCANKLIKQLKYLYRTSSIYNQLGKFFMLYKTLEDHYYIPHFVRQVVKRNRCYFEQLHSTEVTIESLTTQMNGLKITDPKEEIKDKIEEELEKVISKLKTLSINPPQYDIEGMTEMMRSLKI